MKPSCAEKQAEHKKTKGATSKVAPYFDALEPNQPKEKSAEDTFS